MNATTGTVALLGLALVLTSCGEESDRVAGNSANTGNAQAVGRVVLPSGNPAPDVWVECRPDSLTPWDRGEPGWTSLTDSLGRYRCTDLPGGRVGIAVSDPGTGLSRWRDDTLAANETSSRAAPDTLALPGKVRVALPPGTTGTLYFTGLNRTAAVRGDQELEIADVPAGWAGEVKFARSIANTSTIDSGIRVRSGQTDSAGYTRRSQTLRVPLAGGIASAVAQLPLLVRLDSTWSGFATSLPDGSDLRLATTGGKALPLTVATWDRAGRAGSVWTLLDSLAAPGDSVDLVLSWGLPVPSGTPASAFASSKGWIAAWPLGDTGSTVFDRVGAFPGTATMTSSVAGVVGKASLFDGRLSVIQVPSAAGSALDLPEGGPYTLSCWTRLADLGTSRYILGRASVNGFGLKFQKSLGTDTNNWLASDVRGSGTPSSWLTLAPADSARWTQVTVTVKDSVVAIYLDGVRKDVGKRSMTNGQYRSPGEFAIGAAIDTAGIFGQFYHGEISEVWIQGVVRSPEWIRLTAANQRIGAPVAKAAK